LVKEEEKEAKEEEIIKEPVFSCPLAASK